MGSEQNVQTKIAFVSLGCDKNLVDSEIMLGLIDEEGYTITPDEDQADIVIINTCGFILDATEEGIENILRIAAYKSEGKLKGLIVTGCMAQRYKEQIFEELPEVDAVVGTGDFAQIGDVIKDVLKGQQVNLITSNMNTLDPALNLKRMITTPGHFAYLKIAEGCDSHCTYCTIPSIRGQYRSRTIESLVEEATMLVSKGVSELILVAQDTGLYGKDLYGTPKLHVLLAELSKISDLVWIRILYCYPEHITEDIIDAMAQNEKVCHYLDMPIQHSENGVLKRMGRRSTREGLQDIIAKLRHRMPDICLRTTLIVGFPGETQAEFDSLVTFVEEARFDRLGVFAYSKEDGTPAFSMPNQVDDEVKEERKELILEAQKHISAAKCDAYVGKTLQVIVEGRLPEDDIYCGRSFRDCYDIDGLVFFKSDESLMTGQFLHVHITESSDYDLIGEIVYEPTE